MRPEFKRMIRPVGINLMLITLLLSLTVRVPDSAPAPLKNLFNSIMPSAEAAHFLNGKIAFNSNRDGNDEIYVMNADGTSQVNLTNNPAVDSNPFWSPNGKKIAFESNRDSNFEIYVMNANGTSPTRLTFNGVSDSVPAFSPDGTKIAFHSNQGGDFEIFVMNADGSGRTQLTNNSVDDFTPKWSPDGTQIVFRSDRDGNN